ncbi:SMI1/KNR4 family protein [Streptosporangium canum]
MSGDLTALDRLVALVPPPAVPSVGAVTWEEVCADMRVQLPADYVAFIERYGACQFARWLSIYDPRRLPKDYRRQVAEWGDDYRDMRDDDPEAYPLAMWPEAGGFLPWGSTIDGEDMGWLTAGDPVDWPVIVLYRHDVAMEPVSETMTEFLAGWVSGERYGGRGVDNAGRPLKCAAWE